MKKLLLIVLATACLHTAKAQYNRFDNNDDIENRGFKKENVFIGGSLSLGFGSGSFAVGGNPEIGYSFNRVLDAGLAFNLNYYSQKDYYNNSYKYSSFNYGGGVFLRAWPVPFLFAQLQPEINWISYTEKYPNSPDYKNTVSAASLIAGIGYGQHLVGQGNYFFMIGLDLLNDTWSPYRYYGSVMPIIRGGFDIYLKPSRKQAPAGPIL